MFAAEYNYARMRRKSLAKGHRELALEGQRQWRTDEPGPAEGVGLPGRCVYAQNDAYLELCNPGWDMQGQATFGTVGIVPCMLSLIWLWYGMAVHPLLFNQMFFAWHLTDSDPFFIWFGWLLLFPLAAFATVLLYGWFIGMGVRTCFFTSLRGRIRFNRLTRKVYVLRPGYCGGNKVFEWERLVALMHRVSENDRQRPFAKEIIGSLVLYQPPSQPGGEDEDAIFVGPSLLTSKAELAADLWEYIRLYMEDGPTVDEIPRNAPSNYKKITRNLPADYSTYCGKPGYDQYRMEQPFGEAFFHILGQATCSWPKFPKEWQSDSGLGEPEDKPVQTGAVMTAVVYSLKGKLSKADDIEFMRRYGTKEALRKAMARDEDK